MRVLERCTLGLSRDVLCAPCGWAEVEPSESTTSVGRGRELFRTDMCSSRMRPAWKMLGLGPGISGAVSTMVPLVKHELPGLRRMQRVRCERPERSREASVCDEIVIALRPVPSHCAGGLHGGKARTS